MEKGREGEMERKKMKEQEKVRKRDGKRESKRVRESEKKIVK